MLLQTFSYSFLGMNTHWISTIGFPGSSDGKEFACHEGGPGSIPPESGRSSGDGIDYSLQCSCLENSTDWPWGRKDSNTTEQLTHTHGPTSFTWMFTLYTKWKRKEWFSSFDKWRWGNLHGWGLLAKVSWLLGGRAQLDSLHLFSGSF